MQYKLISRITNGNKTIGYTLIDNRNKTIHITREDTIELAKNNLIDNVEYSKTKKGLKGKNGIDLRSLPVSTAHNIVRPQLKYRKSNNTSTNSCNAKKSNHDLAKEYMNKLKLLAKDSDLLFDLSDNDEVILMDVLDRYSTGSIQIPSFVTSILGKAFSKTKFTSVVINNQPNKPFNAKNLFMNMESSTLKVRFAHPECVIDTTRMFACSSMEYIDIDSVITSSVTNMYGMFSSCRNLKQIRFGNVDTSGVTCMQDMFRLCTSLVKLDLSGFNFESVDDMSYMFSYCVNLKEITFRELNTIKLIRMNGVFYRCTNLMDACLNKFNTHNVKYMKDMFYGCENLKGLDISTIDTSSLLDITNMFEGCSRIKVIKLPKMGMPNLKCAGRAFAKCVELEYLDLSKIKSSSLYYVIGLCIGDKKLRDIGIDKEEFDSIIHNRLAFEGCELLESGIHKSLLNNQKDTDSIHKKDE